MLSFICTLTINKCAFLIQRAKFQMHSERSKHGSQKFDNQLYVFKTGLPVVNQLTGVPVFPLNKTTRQSPFYQV